jgi:hypothetical protein
VCSSDVINVFKLSKKDLDAILLRFPEVSENIQEEAKRRMGNETNNAIVTSSQANTDTDVTRELLKNVSIQACANLNLDPFVSGCNDWIFTSTCS